MKKFIILSLYGQKAVTMAYGLQAGMCFCSIPGKNGRKIAQMEVVIDEPGLYKGLEQKWVDVTIMPGAKVEDVLLKLAEFGFAGCFTGIYLESEYGEQLSDFVYLQI